MSLVSAAVDNRNVPLAKFTSGSSAKNLAYQTTGKPLSKEALYRAKLKNETYKLASKNTGADIKDSKLASNAAINLANSNQSTIQAYKRLLDPDASRAAIKVGTGESRLNSLSTVSSINGPKLESSNAASKALSSTRNSFVEVNNSGTNHMNISKVFPGAEKNASKLIDLRMNPERCNFSYGLSGNSIGKTENGFKLTDEIIENIYSKSQYIAEVESEVDPKNYATSAASATKKFDPKKIAEKELAEKEEAKKLYVNQITSQEVLLLARSKAQEKLKEIDKVNSEKMIFNNEEYNRVAVAIAQKNSEHRIKTTGGKVYMGGGLWLTPKDVDNIALGLITPILEEVNQRASDQRDIDSDLKRRNIEYKQQYSQWQILQKEKLRNDKAFSKEITQKHENEMSQLQNEMESKFKKLCESKELDVHSKSQELKKLKEYQKNFEKEMQELLKQEYDRHELQISELGKSHELDLIQATNDQKEFLKPYEDSLKATERECNKLSSERDSISNEILKLRESIELHKSKINDINVQLNDISVKYEDEEKVLNNIETSKDNISNEINTHFLIIAQNAKEQAALSTEEARLKQLEVSAMINERKSELNRTDLELKKERLALLESMKSVCELKGDVKLDETKLRTLVGITPDEVSHTKVEVDKLPEVSEKYLLVSEPDEQLQESALRSEPVKLSQTVHDLVSDDVVNPQRKNFIIKKALTVSHKSANFTHGLLKKPNWRKKLLMIKEKTSKGKNMQEQTLVHQDNNSLTVQPIQKTKFESQGSMTTKKLNEKNPELSENLVPTFSGFSQGSFIEEQSNVPSVDLSKPVDDETSKLNDIEDIDIHKKKLTSLFKEVF